MSQHDSFNGAKARITRLTLHLLRPLSRLWLRHGFSAYEIQELLRWSMTRVALQDPEFVVSDREAHRQTMARAAILTGLPRREVQRLTDLDSPDIATLEHKYHRGQRLLAGWLADSEFLDAKGEPRSLPMRSATEKSFTDLAYRYCRDVPARAMADELILRGNIRRLPGRVLALVDPYAHEVRGSGEEVNVLETKGGSFADALNEALEGIPTRYTISYEDASTGIHELQTAMKELLRKFELEAVELLKRFEDGTGVRDGGEDHGDLPALSLSGDKRRPVH